DACSRTEAASDSAATTPLAVKPVTLITVASTLSTSRRSRSAGRSERVSPAHPTAAIAKPAPAAAPAPAGLASPIQTIDRPAAVSASQVGLLGIAETAGLLRCHR